MRKYLYYINTPTRHRIASMPYYQLLQAVLSSTTANAKAMLNTAKAGRCTYNMYNIGKNTVEKMYRTR